MNTSEAITQIAKESTGDLSGLQKIVKQVGKVSTLGTKGASQLARQGIPRATYSEASDQSTPVPVVKPPEFGFLSDDTFSRSPQATRTTKPLSPIERIRQEAVRKSIRQRAAEDPTIASTLLGGLGSANLLNRP